MKGILLYFSFSLDFIKESRYLRDFLYIYAPTENAETEVKEEIVWVPKEDAVIVLGNFNIQRGKEKHIEQVAEKFTIHKNM